MRTNAASHHLSRCALIVALMTAAALLFAPAQRSPLLLFNRTPSLPTGLYVYRGSSVHRGDVVAFALPPSAWHYAALRGASPDFILLKHVLAISGDLVSTLNGELRVNSVLVGEIAAIDPAGRSLPRWSAARVLAGDELLVGSSHARSFDSRYFGPIHAGQVFGVYRRLSFGASPVAPIHGESLHDPPHVESLAAPRPDALGRSAVDQRASEDGSREGCVNAVWQDQGAAVNAARNCRVYRELGFTGPMRACQPDASNPCCTVTYR